MHHNSKSNIKLVFWHLLSFLIGLHVLSTFFDRFQQVDSINSFLSSLDYGGEISVVHRSFHC